MNGDGGGVIDGAGVLPCGGEGEGSVCFGVKEECDVFAQALPPDLGPVGNRSHQERPKFRSRSIGISLLGRTLISELSFRACVHRPSSFPSVARPGRYAAKVIGSARRFDNGPLQGQRTKPHFGNSRFEEICCCTSETHRGATPESDRQIRLSR